VSEKKNLVVRTPIHTQIKVTASMSGKDIEEVTERIILKGFKAESIEINNKNKESK
jgi:hypothetical protein